MVMIFIILMIIILFPFLKETIDDLGQYGLLEPTSTIIVEYLPPEGIQGPNWEVLMEVGNLIEDGSGYYAKAIGQPALLTIDVQWYETLERLVDERPDLVDKTAAS